MDSSSTDAELLARSVAEPALFAGLYERFGLANPPVASVADSACRPSTAPSSTATTESWSGGRACAGRSSAGKLSRDLGVVVLAWARAR